MYPRPVWDPLPEPPGPDPATLTEFQDLAAELMAGVEDGDSFVGMELGHIGGVADDALLDSEALGLDVAAGAEELLSMIVEAEPDTLEPELVAAAEQDAELQAVGDELGGEMGESLKALPEVEAMIFAGQVNAEVPDAEELAATIDKVVQDRLRSTA